MIHKTTCKHKPLRVKLPPTKLLFSIFVVLFILLLPLVGWSTEFDTPGYCEAPSGTALICVNAFQKQPSLAFAKPSRLILRPNQSIRLSVLVNDTTIVKVTRIGERGLYTPGTRSITKTSAPPDSTPSAALTTPKPTYVDFAFGPQKPGSGTLKIELTKGATTQEFSVEYEVERTYSGALRIGVATIMGNAVDAEFEAKTLGGSQQAEIVNTLGPNMDLEVVVGYAPFLDSGGRGYINACYPFCFAPYAGLGVVSTSKGVDFDLLKSLHLGLEWSPVPSTSIALAGVVRRVDRLYQGRVGDPVSGTPVTVSGFDWGFSFVVNFSPDFLRFAAQPLSGFLGTQNGDSE